MARLKRNSEIGIKNAITNIINKVFKSLNIRAVISQTDQKMIKLIRFTFLFLLLSAPAYAQTASILPLGRTQYFDNNGNPLAGGKVYNYIPATTTFKTTWQDSAEAVANTNPVTLDAAGRALIYGEGNYRQIVRKSNGDLVWDAVTSSTGSGGGSASTGDGDLVGTVKPWAGITAPNQYAFAYGQELSRTTYSVLKTAITLTTNVICTSTSNTLTGISDTGTIPVGAPVEVLCMPAGTTVVSKTASTVVASNPATLSISASAIFYPFGNGDGSTTFNVPDLRGYTLAGRDNMGGTAAARLTTTYFGSNTPDAQGATGGSQSTTLITGNLPAYTPAGTVAITDPGHTHTYSALPSGANFPRTDSAGSATATATTGSNTTGITAGFTGTAQGGISTAFSRIQPTITFSYIIKITPDTNSSIATGVTDIDGMVGSITCGTGLLCTGNTISAISAAGAVTGPGSSTDNAIVRWNGTGGNTVQNSIPTISDVGTLTVNPTAGLNNAILTTSTISGTQVGGFSGNFISATDSAALGSNGSTIGALLNVSYTVGGPTMIGSRFAQLINLTFNSPSNAANTDFFGLAIASSVTVTSGDGGTNTGAGSRGSFLVSNPVAHASALATNLTSLGAYEMDVSCQGCTVGYKYILALTSLATDTAQAAGEDVQLMLSAVAGRVGAKNSIRFSNRHGAYPVTAAGNLISSDTGSALSGVDFSLVTFAGSAWKSPGANISPTGIFSTGAVGTTGQLKILGTTSGTVIQTVQATAGTPTVTWGTSTGTPAVTASSPLAITAATGNITCTTCLTSASTLNLVVGTTTISSGTTTRILYDNAGVLGEYTISGSGTVVAMATGATLTTAVGAGTWTASGTWTLPAITLGGTVSGGGNQINNVIIGTTTPLAGFFTTLSASTSLTSPLHIGGSGTTGVQLTLQSTSGNGTTDQIAFQGGNNGATTFGSMAAAGWNVEGAATPGVNMTVGGVGKAGFQWVVASGAFFVNTFVAAAPIIFRINGAETFRANAASTASTSTTTGAVVVAGTGGLGVGGAISATLAAAAGDNLVCVTAATGLFSRATTVVGCVPSAMRFKDIFGIIDGNKALNGIASVDAGIYSYKPEIGLMSGIKMIGLYAEQICAIDDLLCHRDDNGRIDNYDKIGATAYSFAAIKQLKFNNDNIVARLDQLEKRLNGMGK